jgi:hypothetical protein
MSGQRETNAPWLRMFTFLPLARPIHCWVFDGCNMQLSCCFSFSARRASLTIVPTVLIYLLQICTMNDDVSMRELVPPEGTPPPSPSSLPLPLALSTSTKQRTQRTSTMSSWVAHTPLMPNQRDHFTFTPIRYAMRQRRKPN